MRAKDYAKLLEDLEREILLGARSIGILGLTTVTVRLFSSLTPSGLISAVKAIYTAEPADADETLLAVPSRPFEALRHGHHDVLVVADDEKKEDLLRTALPHIRGTPKVIVAGYGHLKFRDSVFQEQLANLLVPSLANGYPNTLIHLYQCLLNGARLGLSGVVAEFGMFKGGTTMFLSRLIDHLGMDWPVIGFDTFGGFPSRRSCLDMYANQDCVFTDLPGVSRYLKGRNVEIIPGDIVETAQRLKNEKLVLTFIDTDNYTPAKAALDVVEDRTLLGGAIVFDHFTGVDRFRYTLGERIAGFPLLDDSRYFHLHDTGVFYRQR